MNVAEVLRLFHDDGWRRRLVMNETKGVRERTAACDKPKGKLSFN